jgi:hypothetical protein
MKNIFLAVSLVVISIMPAKSQEDSCESSFAKKFGVALFPFENRAGIAYCFGKKERMKIEYDFKLPFSETVADNQFGKYLTIDELSFTYAWNRTAFKKLYSGIAVHHEVISYSPEQKFYAFSPAIIPLGIELFPSKRLPCLSIILESSYKYSSGLGGRIGLYCGF